MIAYCQEQNIPVKASIAKPYSSDENCLHISYEAGKLEDLAVNGVELVDFGMTVLAARGPRQNRKGQNRLRVGRAGERQRRAARRRDIVSRLNEIGGRNGIGHIDMVENRFVGMKSRGVYKAPGMTLLYAAHRVVEQLTLDRDLAHLRDRLAPEVAEMVYYGFWYHAKLDALWHSSARPRSR